MWAVASSGQPDESISLKTPGDVENHRYNARLPGSSAYDCTDVVEMAEMLVHIGKAVGRSRRHRRNRICSSAITA